MGVYVGDKRYAPYVGSKRRKVMTEKALPYDAEIEYLESSGAQYIDTGVYPDSTYTFDTDVTLLSNINTVFWGCRSSGNFSSQNRQCYLSINPPNGIYYIYLYSTAIADDNNWKTDFIPVIGTMYPLRGITVVSTMSTMTYPITLFAFNNIGNITKMSCRIGSFTAYSNGVKVCDMIPVRVGQVGYMYDKVSGELFGNSGTGDFTLGSDIIMTSQSNPEVMAICYAQGWAKHADYMTKREAEAVTSIGTVFRGNTSITHFEEFEYFTSITSIGENAFYDCTSLTSIIFPTSVVSTGTRSFFRCSALVDVNIANASILGTLTFYSCTSLESIDISNVHALGVGVFTSCSKLSYIGDVSNVVTMDTSTGNGIFENTLLQGDYEFTNFTGTVIPTNLFYHVSGITNASFPKSQYTEVGAGAFNGAGIKSFVIREGCLVLNNHSFTLPLMEYLDIPSTVTTWNGFACYYNGNQKVIVCRAATPPAGLNSTNFARVPSLCKVYVPNASIAAYEAATGWSNLTGRYVPIEGSWYETHREIEPNDE